MTKNEMKNKISMALKDPILQQGFEIICKNLTELEKENAEMKARLNAINLLTPELEKHSKENKKQLTKAKEILKKFLDSKNIEETCVAELVNTAYLMGKYEKEE